MVSVIFYLFLFWAAFGRLRFLRDGFVLYSPDGYLIVHLFPTLFH